MRIAYPDARSLHRSLVMPGLVPGIHVLEVTRQERVDGRVKPGHDDDGFAPRAVQWQNYTQEK